ncbi:hypothetical protein Bca4012_008099 [Brassica carinata]
MDLLHINHFSLLQIQPSPLHRNFSNYHCTPPPSPHLLMSPQSIFFSTAQAQKLSTSCSQPSPSLESSLHRVSAPSLLARHRR